MREKVSKEVFGCPYLEEKDLETIINECDTNHKRWANVLEQGMKSYRKSLGRAVAGDIDKIMDNLVSSDRDINKVTAKVDAALGLAAELNTAPITVPAESQNDDFFCTNSTGVSELGQSIDGLRLSLGCLNTGRTASERSLSFFPRGTSCWSD
ncbi:hypothetical protein SEMRO_1977_G308900.1 [Seminavis robusta]|uniref:Uncharacterized protein n=1 Tax=Seminavis robusta TaxID=568900 RepID=A0A9N8HWH4_9STRA|nr:hypothetical protein SEMRO_1977_G308900.1 [Seminavis robusta]|eukprot:Sro1977_g308900.1 n/a (153) ;mRNA; f:2469-2927